MTQLKGFSLLLSGALLCLLVRVPLRSGAATLGKAELASAALNDENTSRLCRKLCEESGEGRMVGGGCAHLCPGASDYFVEAYVLGTREKGLFSTLPPACPRASAG